MRLYFCRSSSLSSWAVRASTWSRWSHVGIQTPEGTILEAVFPQVREVPLATFLADNGEAQAVDFPLLDPVAAAAWGRLQAGKPYDLGALVGLLFRRNWRNPARWFCSEIAAAYAEAGGSPLIRASALFRVSPETLWILPGKDVDR